MSAFQLLVVPPLVAVALWMAVRTLRRELPRRSGVLWTGLWSGAGVLVAFPSATAFIAASLGIGRGADLVLYGATLSGLAASLYFYNRYRRLEEMLTVIIRREALREASQGLGSTNATTTEDDRAASASS